MVGHDGQKRPAVAGEPVLVPCDQCRGTGHNLRGRIPEIDLTPPCLADGSRDYARLWSSLDRLEQMSRSYERSSAAATEQRARAEKAEAELAELRNTLAQTKERLITERDDLRAAIDAVIERP